MTITSNASPICIYCREPSAGSKQKAHVIPEAIYPGGPVLPTGVECDRCNQYAGSKLETHLVRHPVLARLIQLMGLPGKEGVPRKKLGVFERNAEPEVTVSYPVEPPVECYGPDGNREWRVRTVVDPEFNLARFSRGLHHVGLNVVAHLHGAGRALDSRFNAARRFVRKPKNGEERWTFVQLCEQMERFSPKVRAFSRPLADGWDGWIVGLQFYNAHFYIDLCNTGCLLRTRIRGHVLAAHVVGPDYVPPKRSAPEQLAGGGTRHWMLTEEARAAVP